MTQMTVFDQETGQSWRDIWDALEPNPAKAMNLRMRSYLLTALQNRVKQWGLTQKEASKRLGITQPRLNQLLKGRFTEFSLDALIALLEPAGLELEFNVKAA
jgi:predicted XRE-type DNA-binding protein